MSKHKPYFEGFYLKHQNEELSIAFIPSIHQSEAESYAMIQVITNDFTREFKYPISDASVVDTTFMIENNVFSKEGIYLELVNEEGSIHGRLFYDEMVEPNKDIMGIFKYLPNMECSHGVISMLHKIRGSLIIDEREIDFSNGYGYIEKDSGTSFPKRYLWTHCIFNNISIMMATATIPYLKLQFTGCISNILYKGKQYQLATYKGARILAFNKDSLIIKQGKYKLKARLIKYDEQILKAPKQASMQRRIAESIVCHVYYEFSKNDKILFSFVSNQASFEYSDE